MKQRTVDAICRAYELGREGEPMGLLLEDALEVAGVGKEAKETA